jgi:hypothetical protein
MEGMKMSDDRRTKPKATVAMRPLRSSEGALLAITTGPMSRPLGNRPSFAPAFEDYERQKLATRREFFPDKLWSRIHAAPPLMGLAPEEWVREVVTQALSVKRGRGAEAPLQALARPHRAGRHR